MAHMEDAATFVRAHGTDVERARLEYLLHGQAPSPSIAGALFAGQRPDGGWNPFWAPDYSSIDATCYRLSQAHQLGITSAEPVRRALHFLEERQGSGGSWQEDPEVGDVAPPWVKPGDLAAELYLTANCGYWLALLAGDSGSSSVAGRFLAEYLREDGSLPSFPHAHWLAAGLWYRGGHPAAETVLTYLASRVSSLPASNLGWLWVTLHGAGLPVDHPLLKQAADRLAAQQLPDGRWASEDGPERDVHATLEALGAILGRNASPAPLRTR